MFISEATANKRSIIRALRLLRRQQRANGASCAVIGYAAAGLPAATIGAQGPRLAAALRALAAELSGGPWDSEPAATDDGELEHIAFAEFQRAEYRVIERQAQRRYPRGDGLFSFLGPASQHGEFIGVVGLVLTPAGVRHVTAGEIYGAPLLLGKLAKIIEPAHKPERGRGIGTVRWYWAQGGRVADLIRSRIPTLRDLFETEAAEQPGDPAPGK